MMGDLLQFLRLWAHLLLAIVLLPQNHYLVPHQLYDVGLDVGPYDVYIVQSVVTSSWQCWMHLHCSFIAKPLPHPRHNLEHSRTTKMPAFQAKAWRRSKISCHDICSPTGSKEHLRVRLMIITIIIFGITNHNTKIPLPETDLTTSLAPPATRSSNPPSESERLTKC